MSDLVQYYKNLLIIQYANKTKAVAHMELLAEIGLTEATDGSDIMPNLIQNAFNIEEAIGAQLDIIGKYAGADRRIRTKAEAITLDDDDYRTLIKIAIIKNSSKSSLYDIDLLLDGFFKDQIFVIDHQDMSFTYMIDSDALNKNLADAFIANNLLPRPLGVRVRALIYAPNVGSLFRMGTYTAPEAISGVGFNSYTDYDEDTRFLSYDDVEFL